MPTLVPRYGVLDQTDSFKLTTFRQGADVEVDTNGVAASENNGLSVTFGADLSSRIRDT